MIEVPDRIEALLFDCDGTLADTMPLHHKAWMDSFRAVGAECPPGFLEKHTGALSQTIVMDFNRTFDYDLHVEDFARDKERRVVARLAEACPIAPVVDVVNRFQGKLPMAVVSNGIRDNVVATLRAIGMEDTFDAVITIDDVTRPKPWPDGFLEAARRLGADPCRCLVFEDGEFGIEAGRRAGMIVTDVRPLLRTASSGG